MAAFCAAEKTEEKNPPAAGAYFGALPVGTAGVLVSSSVGVSGAEIALESLLGWPTADADLARRCDIIFPEGLTTTPVCSPGGPLAGTSFRFGDACGVIERGSVGVGGVTVVRGAPESDALGGVLGMGGVSIDGRELFADLTRSEDSV